MSVQEPSASVHPLSPMLPAQGRAPSSSNSIADAPIINPPSGKKTVSKKKKKAQKKQVAKVAKQGGSVDTPDPQRARRRYEPYRKADPTPEPEGNLPADPEDLETLDATAKALYKSDREALEYIEALKRRTTAILEHVNRTDSQLRSHKGTMERIQLFLNQRQKPDDQWTHQQLSGGKDNAEVLGSHESSEEDDVPNPDLFPTLTRDKNRAFPTVEDHLSKNDNHPNLPYDYARDIIGDSAPQLPNDYEEEEDFSRPETPPARQPSLPPGHEDENGLEYAEDEIEMHSDFTVPPDHAAPRSDDSTFDRSGADLRITSDTGLLFPPSEEELARISKDFKREVMDSATAVAMRPPVDPPYLRHPLAQSYVPSSSPGPAFQPKPQHLVFPRPVPRAPSPPRTVLVGKRKRLSTPEDEDNNAGNVAGPSTAAIRSNIFRQVAVRNNEDRVSPKRRKLSGHQPTWDFQTLVEAGYVPTQPSADPPTRENSPEPSSQPAHRQASPPRIATSQLQKEDSELETSQVIEMLSQRIEQGESEDEEEPTRNILEGLSGSRRSLPALIAGNTQATSPNDTQSELETPAGTQIPAEAPAPVPEDVFGPIVLSVKANKISDRLPLWVLEKDTDGDVVVSDSEHETANISSKSTRFSLGGKVEKKEHKVYRKTPIRPRISSRAIEAEDALAAEFEAEGRDMVNPLFSPKKKRAIGARVRKPKRAPSTEAEATVNPEHGPPSISASKPPSRLRRGRSASVQPEVPALPKTPVKKTTRGRK